MPAQNGAASQAPPSGAKVVTPVAYVSLEQVPRTQTVDVALMLNIAPGYHINSHTPSQTYLIPTNVTLADTSGFQPAGSNYPAGQMQTFAFTQDKLSRLQRQRHHLAKIPSPIRRPARRNHATASSKIPSLQRHSLPTPSQGSRPSPRLDRHPRHQAETHASRNLQNRTETNAGKRRKVAPASLPAFLKLPRRGGP